jgi:antitoxin PrlF
MSLLIDDIPSGLLPLITSKLTSKAQTTIPQPVRVALGVAEGDELAYAIENGRVLLTKAPTRLATDEQSADDPFTTFSEWNSDADRKAFANF